MQSSGQNSVHLLCIDGVLQAGGSHCIAAVHVMPLQVTSEAQSVMLVCDGVMVWDGVMLQILPLPT
jgi:hypothetical protein